MKTKIKKLMLTIILVLGAVVLSPAQIVYKKTIRTDGGDISITDCAVNREPYSNSDLQRTRILAKNGTEFAITFPESYQNLSIVRNNQRVEIQGRRVISKEPGPLGFSFTYTENGVSYTCDIIGDVNYYGELKYKIVSSGSQNSIETGETLVIDDNTNLSQLMLQAPSFGDTWWGEWKGNLDDFNEFSTAKTVSLQEVFDNVSKQGNKYKLQVWFMDGTSNALEDYTPCGRSSTWIWIQDNRTPPTYGLNLSQVGQGTVSVSKSQLKAGESATLTAQAAQGWRFDHWEENGQNLGTTNPLTVTMGAQDRSIKAVFKEKARVTLQIVDTNGRELAPSQSQEVTSGGSVTFQVPNLANVNFKGWKRNGQIVETGNTYTLSNVTQNETIQAVFEVPVQSLSLSFTELNLKVGESKPLPSVTVIPSNATDQTITWLSNDPGIAKIENGKVVGVSAGSVNLVASSSNEKKATLKVVVQAVKHTVTVQLVAEGTSQSLGTKSYEVEQGKTVTVKVTELGAEAKYEFVKWDRNGTVSSEQSISFVVNSSETLKAIFKEKVVQPQESDFPPYTANLQTFKVNQTVDASKVVWENFPQGLDKTAIKYSLRDFNGVDSSNNKQIFEVNGQNLTFKKIGSYFLIATLRDNQNNEIRIDFTIQVNE